MGPADGIPAAEIRDRETERERRLRAAQAAFPAWDFHEVFAGWEAVPKGTPVVRSVDLDGIVAKLRAREHDA
jgi:hypothetical protein